MKNLYNELYKNSIKIGDTVSIKKEGSESEKMIQGQINKIFPDNSNGVRVEITLDTQDGEFSVKEIGLIECVLRDGQVEYGSLK